MNSILLLSPAQLSPNPHQPRGKIKSEEIDELAESIKTFGILEPIVVADTPAGYQIIAGERRWRAAMKLGLAEVPAVMRKSNSKGQLEMAIVENVQRQDLEPLERAKAYQQLQQDFGLAAKEIASRIGKSVTHVMSSLALLNLPDAVKDGLVHHRIAEGHAHALLVIPDKQALLECCKRILIEHASVRKAEMWAAIYAKASHKPRREQVVKELSEELENWRQQIKSAFQHADVDVSRSKKYTRMVIKLIGTPEETQKDFERILNLAKVK